MIEAVERYCSKKRNRSSRKEKKPESSGKVDEKKQNLKDRRTSKDSTIEGDSKKVPKIRSPVEREHEGEHSPHGESGKRRKTIDEIDTSVPMDLCKNGESL